MAKAKIRFIALSLLIAIISVALAGCDSLFPSNSDVTHYDKKMDASTGKWLRLDDEDTYFVFDGSEGGMTFSYYEDGVLKYDGGFKSVYRSSPDANNPLTFVITRNDKSKEDWINCYVENLEESFTQFCITFEEEDLGVTDGTVYTHVYRMSELPYRIGTYVLEGKEYTPFAKTGFDDGEYRIPEGTYVSDGGQSLTVLPLMNQSYSLFRYTNGETVIEGMFNIAEDRRTIYLYIEHDIYQKVRNSDKDNYDTTFSICYPPDFYLRGNFDTNDNSIVIDGLYHHSESPSEIDDSAWVFGTYVKQ